MKRDDKDTLTWQLYQDGIDYNTRINLYENVNKNERFYANDQWNGVVANGLPTPVFNIFKRIINYFIAAIMSQNVAMQFTAENVGDDTDIPEEVAMKEAAETITQYSNTLQEKNKMHQFLWQTLLDCAISGDGCGYNYFDASIDTGQLAKGDICLENVDNVNVFFGNPNDKRVQKQPYIIIAFRELVENLKKEAEFYKIPQAQIDLITSDVETDYQSGDRSKIELDNKGAQTGKCQALLKLWKQDGKIYAVKSVRQTDIRPKWDTNLTLYPIAWMNWDQRKNSYHGQALGTGLVPNQIFINKMFAMAMMSQMHTAFPKAIYNKNAISAWNNVLGTAVGIDADLQTNVNNVVNYLTPGNMSEQVFKLIDLAIQYTKDMLGATDAALGEVKPDNTSAIIAVQQSSSIPLETIKRNLYQYVEDIGYIWLDMMTANYGKRKIDIEVMGKRVVKEFDFSTLRNMKMRIKIDVGPSSYWSQISAMQTLDALLQNDRISFLQYLERVPNGIIPKSQELIEELKSQDMKQQFIYEQMARFMETLPPQIQAELQQLPPEEMESRIMEMMMQPPEQQAQQNANMQAQQEQLLVQQQQQEQAVQEQDMLKESMKFQQQVALKQMDNENKLAIAGMKNRN
ncbi:hypothetical protein [Cohnella sp. GCM10027633]|uniref:hypothetical protein n=1 Tax=unclassified Cohnella TaxID=2636738 RepID=UPI00364143A6